MVPMMDEIGPFSATVRWDPIPERDANGEITGYVVNYRISGFMSTSLRRKRQIINTDLDPECIVGGIDNADRNISAGPTETSAVLRNLSKIIIVGVCTYCT